MQKQNPERSIELISPVGMRWLKKHRIGCASFNYDYFISKSGNRYFSRRRIDPRAFHLSDGCELRDLLIRRGSRWLLRHRYKNYLYEDQGTGHGKLTVAGVSIPQSVCVALTDSLRPIAQLVEIPERCLASNLQGRVISARCHGNAVVFRSRIDWVELPKP